MKREYKYILKIITVLSSLLCCFQLTAGHYMHPLEQISFVRGMVSQRCEPYYDAYIQLIRYADSLQNSQHHARPDFNVPGYYVKPQEHRANSLALQQDAFAAYCSALAYKLTGKKAYGEKACYFLNAWAYINNKYSEPDGPLVMSYSGSALLMAAELMSDSPIWKQSDKEQFKNWVATVYRKAANEIRERKNNWADWGRFGSVLSASLLEDEEEMNRNIALIKGDFSRKIAPDGHMPGEVVREQNGLWYTYFSLAPMTAAMWVIYNATGENLFFYEKDGASIKKAIDYLLHYQQHPAEWRWHETLNTGKHDRWPDNLLEAMVRVYGDETYLKYVESSRPHIYPEHHFAWVFPTLMPIMLDGYDEGGRHAIKKGEMESLRNSVRNEMLSSGVNEEKVKRIAESLKPDGTWPGINYSDVSNTGFEHSRHLSNMLVMAKAYKKAGSPLKGKKDIKDAISRSLNYWLKNDFICQNWWWNQIGTPENIMSLLLVMDNDLSVCQIDKALEIVGRGNVHASGARPSGDRIKIAGIQAQKALYNRNEEEFARLMRIIQGEIKFSTGRGMQQDFSFHHRDDRVNNTLSYGNQYADEFAYWASLVAGTKFRFSDEAANTLIDYYLDGICKQQIYGRITDPGVLNRDITRQGEGRVFSPRTPERLMKVSNYRRDELENVANARKGQSFEKTSFAKYFWCTDHFVFQRPGYYTSVRMYSKRTANMEQPYNGEGLMNHFRGDGTNYISRIGKEYSDLTPVCDWMMIPGATTILLDKMPPENEIQKWGLNDFTGAVTDGLYGAVGFDFKSPQTGLSARKAWFFFDDEYVCLGSGIKNPSRKPAITTLNQCYLNGDVIVKCGNDVKKLENGTRTLNDVSWVLHDSIGYLFPQHAAVSISNKEEQGSWAISNRQSDSPKDIVKKDVFKLWLEQRRQNDEKSYEYIIVPSTSQEALEEQENGRSISIIANNEGLQAARNDALRIAYAIFYRSGSVEIFKGTKISIDSPGIVMVKYDGTGKITELTLSDPTHLLSRMHIQISRDGFQTQEISADLPISTFAGSSVIFKY